MSSQKSKKPSLRFVAAAVIAFIGFAVLSYPTVENIAYEFEVSGQKQEFLARTRGSSSGGGSAAGPDQYDELFNFLGLENERLYETGQSKLVDAFSYQTVGVDLVKYDMEDGCIGFVRIPAISVELPIYLGANTVNMEKGAVHLTETSYPIGGINTNSVIAAHRGETRNMFRHIDRLQVGDEVIITNFREVLVYRVIDMRIIDPSDINLVKIYEGRDLVTLVSCHPVGLTTQRYIVICERV